MIRAIQAGGAYFAAIFAAGFAMGFVRVTSLVPKIGELAAVALEIPVMLGVSWFAARWLIHRFGVPEVLGARLAMGGLAFILLQAGEAGLAVWGFATPVEIYLARLATLAGALGLAAQVLFAAIPAVQSGRPASMG